MPDSPPSSRAVQEPDLSGKEIGDYLVLRRLGRGGMAEVYLAQQRSLDRPVALKVLRHSLAGDTNYVRRFHHEARAAATLAQANIVQIFEVGELEGIYFIAQEYVKGQNVKQYLSRHGSVDLFLAINIMRQVSAALVKAADQGVIHRDIKPENIMLSVSGEVKVADFGLARVTHREAATDLTQVGITMGTPLYMSPEQVEGADVDTRSDIYSFGVTCYEMLSGRPPYEGETALAVAVKHLNHEPIPLEKCRPDLPAELCQLIRKMMSKRAADRYQTPAELIGELREIQVEETDDKWAETLHQLSLTDTQLLAGSSNQNNSRTKEQQRLAELMRSQSASSRPSLVFIAISLAILISIGFGVGSLISRLNPPEDLLFVAPEDREQIPVRESAEEQYRLAFQLRTEQAWLAIAENFPAEDSNQNQYYARLADVRLGEFYVEQERYDDAVDVFVGLQQVGENDREFQLIGYAGAAIAFARLEDESQARRAMSTFDDTFADYQRMRQNSPNSWRDFFSDNDYLRNLLEQLREDLNWVERARRPDTRP